LIAVVNDFSVFLLCPQLHVASSLGGSFGAESRIYFSVTRATAFASPARPIRPALNLTTMSAPSIPASSRVPSEAPLLANRRRLFSISPLRQQRQTGEGRGELAGR